MLAKMSASQISDPPIQNNTSIDEAEPSEKEGAKVVDQTSQTEVHLDKAHTTEHQQDKKPKLACASHTDQPASSLKLDCEEHKPEELEAGEVKKNSHKRKRSSRCVKDKSPKMEAHDAGGTIGITNLMESNMGKVHVSNKKSSKASEITRREVDNTTEVTSARSAYIFFVMEEGARVKEENKLDNKDVVKVQGLFRITTSPTSLRHTSCGHTNSGVWR